MSGAPITFKGQHFINALIGISIIILIYYLCATQSSNLFWILIISIIFNWFFIDHSNWWRRYASSNLNA